ncbi:MAG: hypothetical protein ACYCQK_08230 [Acidiferrobacteraceae bacterium]
MNLQGLLGQVSARLDDLSLRERALLFIVVIGAVYFAVNGILFRPLQQRREHLLQALHTEHNRTRTLNLGARVILNESGRTAQSREQLQALKARLAAVDASLSSMTEGLVTPQDMVALVEKVLARSPGIRVVSVQNMPAVAAVSGASPSAALYRHGLKIVVEGRYPALVHYLKSLEGLHWKVFWGRAHLAVVRYPVSRLTLVLYTLSLHRGWIGG